MRKLFLYFFLASACFAQQYVISTVAGGAMLPSPVAATSVPVGPIGGIATDITGNVYFTASNCVFKLDASGMLTRLAGNARAGYSGDGGPATGAQLSNPASIAVDGSGNLFVADVGNGRLRRISTKGVITTLAGSNTNPAFVEGGPAITTYFGSLNALAVDSAGNIFVADAGYEAVRLISSKGLITTVAGGGGPGYSGDGGPAIQAKLAIPDGLALDGAGNLFIADSNNNCVRKVAADGTITTFAGTGFAGLSGDGGQAVNAQLAYPQGLAFDGSGNLLIADSNNFRIRSVASNGIISTVAGNGTFGLTGDGGPAIGAELTRVSDIAVDPAGNILIDSPVLIENYPVAAERNGNFTALNGFIVYAALGPVVAPRGISVLRKVSAGGTITTVAGNAASGAYGLGGAATGAQFGSAQSVAVDGAGNLFIADPIDNYVLKVSVAGTVTLFAGNGKPGFSGDGGSATLAQLNYPAAVTVDTAGNVFIADQDNGRIRKVSANGIITTVAGNGDAGYAGDGGQATNAEIARPVALAVDTAGNLFTLDSQNAVVRRVSTNGIITTVAGNGSIGYSGDGGLAVNATMSYPSAIALDTSGDIFIADTDNDAIRKVSASGMIATVSRVGLLPTGVAVDGSGNLLIASSYVVSRLSASGVPTAIGGTGSAGNSGDGGPAASAQLGSVYGMAVDASGDVFLADSSANSLRKLTPTSQTVSISSVVDAASELAGPISPGKIIVIYGSGLGPVGGATAKPANGVFGTQLAGTTVSVNGVAAPVFFTSATQVNAIVPYEVSGATAGITVAYQSGISSAISVPIAASAPSIFSYNSTGAGQVAAFNVVDGTANTAANPVKVNGYIELFATGEGQTSPAGVDGRLGTATPAIPVLPVSVIVGGLPAVVQYKGGIFGAVAGLMQVNVQIPPGVKPGGYVPVVLTVGNSSTVDGALWIAVSQ